MKRFFVVSLALASFTACGGRNSGNDYNSLPPYVPPISPNPPVVPDFDQDDDIIFRYQPDFLRYDWIYSEFAEMPRELAPAADDLYRYWESWRDSWSTDLNHGYIPEVYLSRIQKAPNNIDYVDVTEGRVLGLEKLPPVLDRAFERCPSLDQKQFEAPLQVRWAEDDGIASAGRFFRQYLRLVDESGLKLWSNTQFFPAIVIKGEYSHQGVTVAYPNQTVREIDGADVWDEIGGPGSGIDRTFAHEYGHFLMQAWALNNGRSMVQSWEFSELFAELFLHLCWGSILERPGFASRSVEFDTRNGRPFDSFYELLRNPGSPNPYTQYDLRSLEMLIMWEIHNGRFEPNKMLISLFDTLSQMRGRKLDTYPAYDRYGTFLARAPWAADDSRVVLEDRPVIFTRSEFLELFCDNYPCGEIEYLVAADAEGKRKMEW